MINFIINGKSNKIKLFIALLYVIAVSLYSYIYCFQNLQSKEITSDDFIKNNRNYFFELKETIYFYYLFLFLYFVFCGH